MTTSEANWACCITPIVVFYSIWSINRGWNILKHNQMSLDFPSYINKFLARIFRGEEGSARYEDNMLANTELMRQSGWYSFIGGFVALAICIFWIYLLIVQF